MNMPSNFVQKTILTLSVFLLAFLPITHFMGLIITDVLGLPEFLLLWKELLVGVIILLQLWVVAADADRDLKPGFLYVAVVALGVGSSIIENVPLRELLLGFRVELFWVAFVASTWMWLKSSTKYLKKNLHVWDTYIMRGVVVGFALVNILSAGSLVFGPVDFYTSLGIEGGWERVGEVRLQSPLCHSVDTIGDDCRLTGGFATPNNFAGYLLLILPIFLVEAYSSYLTKERQKVAIWLGLSGWIVVSIFLSYSRFAYLSLGMMALLLGYKAIQIKFRKNHSELQKGLIILLSIPVVLLAIFLSIGYQEIIDSPLPTSLTKPGSTIDHYKKTKANYEAALNKFPEILVKGYGLGQSGTIAKPQYKDVEATPIVEENLEIAAKYEIKPWEFPVPENWYLQLVLNGGLLYALFYVMLISRPLKYLWGDSKRIFILSLGLYTIFVGNLILHIWENPVISIYFVLMLLFIKVVELRKVNIEPFLR